MRKTFISLALLVLFAVTLPAHADDVLDTTGTPRWGEINIDGSPFPDPFIVTLIGGGEVNVHAHDGIPAECRGTVSARPDVRITLSVESWALLRLFVLSEGDTTLLVQLPDGTWRCNDDYNSIHPLLDLEAPTQGTYNVWVGTHNEPVGGYLMLTQSPDIMPGQIVTPLLNNPASTGVSIMRSDDETLDCESGLEFTCEPNYGEITLESGFTPDPFTLTLVSGGNIRLDEQGMPQQCRGNVTAPPDFRLNLSSVLPRLRIFFVADVSGDDATLIVRDTAGNWVCNDDSHNFNPMVEFTDAAVGEYDIWVGSFTAGQFISGTLYIAESNRTPENP